MEEVLSNQQARPGDATQLMHVIFSSDDEMMAFYLTLNRFMNPESYLVERTDRKRLEASPHSPSKVIIKGTFACRCARFVSST